MKIKLFFLALFFAGLTSCEKKNIPEDLTNVSKYPIETPFTEYTFTESSCNWINLKPNKIVIINSTEELQNYMECTDTNYPEVNFSKYSLLRVKGVVTSSPADVMEIRLTQVLENKYVLYIKVRRGQLLTPGYWDVSMTTQKLYEDAVITLDVEQVDN